MDSAQHTYASCPGLITIEPATRQCLKLADLLETSLKTARFTGSDCQPHGLHCCAFRALPVDWGS